MCHCVGALAETSRVFIDPCEETLRGHFKARQGCEEDAEPCEQALDKWWQSKSYDKGRLCFHDYFVTKLVECVRSLDRAYDRHLREQE